MRQFSLFARLLTELEKTCGEVSRKNFNLSRTFSGMKDLAESRKVNAISAFERVRTFLSFVFTEADRLIMTHTSEILTLHHNCLRVYVTQ